MNTHSRSSGRLYLFVEIQRPGCESAGPCRQSLDRVLQSYRTRTKRHAVRNPRAVIARPSQ